MDNRFEVKMDQESLRERGIESAEKILPIFLKGSNVFCLVSTVKVAGISMETTSGLQCPMACHLLCVIQTIITTIKMTAETRGSRQQKVKTMNPECSCSSPGDQSTGGLVGEELCILTQPLGLLRTSTRGELAPCSLRFSCLMFNLQFGGIQLY